MKKLLPILSFLLFLAFIISGLYVFGIPPFQAGGPFVPKPANTKQNPTSPTAALPSVDSFGSAKTYDEHLKRAKILEDNNYTSLAILEYEEAAKLQPQNPDPFLAIGKIHLRNREDVPAQESFQKAIQLNPSDIESQVYLGRALLGQRKISEAADIFNKITADNQNAKYYQGVIAGYIGDYEKSKNLLNQAIKVGTSPDIANKSQNFLNAYHEYDFNQGGTTTHLKALLARSLDQTGEYQMAIPLLFEVIKEKKDYRDAWVMLGYAYLNLEKYQDALEALVEAKKIDPQKPETLFFLGLSYYGLNNLPQAAQSLEMAKKNGFEPVIQVDQKLAEIYVEMEDYNKAASNYENVVGLNDNDINYYVRPIWIYLEKLKAPEKALALAQKALIRHPNEAMSYNLLAWAQIHNNLLAEAEKNLNHGLKINPNLDAIYLNLGLLYEAKGQNETAIAYYQKAHQMGNGNGISGNAAERYNNLIAKTKNLDPAKLGNLKADLFQQ